MSASNSTASGFGPVGETSDEILLEKMFLSGSFITGFGFALQLGLFGRCLSILLRRKSRTPFIWFLIGFITVQLIVSGVYTGITAWSVPLTYVDNRNYPGGPLGFILVEFSSLIPANAATVVLAYIVSIFSDGLLVWRCRVIFASFQRKAQIVLIFPLLLYLASIAMSILGSVVSITPGAFFAETEAHIVLSYFALSMTLNVLISLMITARIIIYQRQSRSIFGQRSAQHYTTIWKIFVESASLYAILSIILMATYATNSPVQQLFLGLFPSVQAITDYLIIYLVAEGSAWNTTQQSDTLPSLQFRDGSGTLAPSQRSQIKSGKSSVGIVLDSVNVKSSLGSGMTAMLYSSEASQDFKAAEV